MENKKLLLLLFVISFYVFVSKPLNDDIKNNIVISMDLNKKICKERFILKKKKEIEEKYPKFLSIKKYNKSLFFKDSSVSNVMSLMQQMIKKVAEKYNLTIENVSWGDVIEKKEYKIFPLSFSVKGKSRNIILFVRELERQNKILRFYSFYWDFNPYTGKSKTTALVFGFGIRNR